MLIPQGMKQGPIQGQLVPDESQAIGYKDSPYYEGFLKSAAYKDMDAIGGMAAGYTNYGGKTYVTPNTAVTGAFQRYLKSLPDKKPTITTKFDEPTFRQPGDMGRYVAFNDPGQPGAGFSSYEEYLSSTNTGNNNTTESSNKMPVTEPEKKAQEVAGKDPKVTSKLIQESPNELLEGTSGQLSRLVTPSAVTADTTGLSVTSPVATSALGQVLETAKIGDVKDVAIQEKEFTKAIDLNAIQGQVSDTAMAQAVTEELDPRATTQYQLSELYKTIEEGKPLPPWASPAVRKISSIMQQRGMGSSSMAAAAMTQAIMESGISIAAQDAKAFSQIQLVNLSNRQKVAMQNAVVVSQMDQLNANNKTKGAIANAQAFLTMDLKNLENAQKEAILNHNADMQALFTDTAAENAREQFNAKNEIQVEEFFAELDSQVQSANKNRESAMKQYNASQQNAMQQFAVQTRDARDKFNANMKFAVDQSNAQWRRQLNTTNTAIQNETNRLNAQNTYNASQSALNFLWQKMRDNAQFNFQKGQNSLQKNHEVGLLAMEFANTEKLYSQKQKDLVGLKIGEWIANWVVS